jgi:hypothetical protein
MQGTYNPQSKQLNGKPEPKVRKWSFWMQLTPEQKVTFNATHVEGESHLPLKVEIQDKSGRVMQRFQAVMPATFTFDPERYLDPDEKLKEADFPVAQKGDDKW